MPSSIVRVTALDHDRIQRLVRRACANGPSQQRWRDELVHLVTAHRSAEDETLTTEVVTPGGPIALAGRDDLRRVDEALDEVATALTTTSLTSPDVDDLGRRLQELLAAHAEVLAGQVLGPLEQAVPRKEMRRLGGAYVDRRDQVLRAKGEAEPPRRLDLSRAELYELARRAGVEGRSAMSRRDLIAELERRQQTR